MNVLVVVSGVSSKTIRSILIVNITGNRFFKNFPNQFLQQNSTRM